MFIFIFSYSCTIFFRNTNSDFNYFLYQNKIISDFNYTNQYNSIYFNDNSPTLFNKDASSNRTPRMKIDNDKYDNNKKENNKLKCDLAEANTAINTNIILDDEEEPTIIMSVGIFDAGCELILNDFCKKCKNTEYKKR